MNISSFDELVRAAREQSEPQRLLFVFAGAVLPADSTPEQRARFEAGEGVAIGCGRTEAPQPCIGVCQDRKVEFVYALDHEAALAALARARSEIDTLTALVRQIAHTTPRHGEWETTYRALQKRARFILEQLYLRASGREPRLENVDPDAAASPLMR